MNFNKLRALLLLSSIVLITGCTALWQNWGGHEARKGISSSLVDYLYPNGEIPPMHDNTIPNLHLPLRVGLAFVPSTGYSDTPGLSEAHKAELLEKAKSQFTDRKYVKGITIIPDTYLKSSKGFDSVDQIARLYGLDVMALVSYDQVVHSDDTKASIFYWTIVGAYVVKGSKNDVQTFVDTAIFDIKTHKLLLRAPGIDKIEVTSTLVNSVEELRKNRETGFTNAIESMVVNLDKELTIFKERIKQDKSVTITKSESYGSGAFGFLSLLFLCVIALTKEYRSRRSRDLIQY
ncbi:MAG: rhombotarget lipoprotein [Colwellia sp.]|nr:rhombotarget lipoprotein [Colwellia sp.]